jgi:ribonuclease HI|tara:strand:+ start:10164 stop:10610 length:447 start_codon:yes stop_codon:yes gene_type:complete
MKRITVFTDGGARGNPGPAGAGAVIFDENDSVLKEVSKFLGRQTNNFAEYEAVILGLQTLKKVLGKKKLKEYKVEVKLDSELVAEQLSGSYQIKEASLIPQFIKIHNMRISDFPNISFTHIPRSENKKADRLANEAMDKKGETKKLKL